MQTFQQNDRQEIPTQVPIQDEEVTLQITSHQNSFEKPSLSPFVANTLEGSRFVFVSYCPRHNMIIACFYNETVKFYDATTLLLLEGRKVQKLHGYVTCMSYHDQTDVFIIGCSTGYMYAYNASSEELKQLGKFAEKFDGVVFINSKFPMFAFNREGTLLIADLEKETVDVRNSRNVNCKILESLQKRNLFLSSFEDGSVRLYRMKKKFPKVFVQLELVHQLPDGWMKLR